LGVFSILFLAAASLVAQPLYTAFATEQIAAVHKSGEFDSVVVFSVNGKVVTLPG